MLMLMWQHCRCREHQSSRRQKWLENVCVFAERVFIGSNRRVPDVDRVGLVHAGHFKDTFRLMILWLT
jgi:hypothetical protein